MRCCLFPSSFSIGRELFLELLSAFMSTLSAERELDLEREGEFFAFRVSLSLERALSRTGESEWRLGLRGGVLLRDLEWRLLGDLLRSRDLLRDLPLSLKHKAHLLQTIRPCKNRSGLTFFETGRSSCCIAAQKVCRTLPAELSFRDRLACIHSSDPSPLPRLSCRRT